MTVTDEMVLVGAKALHEAWRSAVRLGAQDSPWDDLHKSDKATYLKHSRTALTAALSDQVVVPKEPTPEMLDSAFVNGPLPMTGLDGSEQAKRERTTVAEIYRAMIDAAATGTR